MIPLADLHPHPRNYNRHTPRLVEPAPTAGRTRSHRTEARP